MNRPPGSARAPGRPSWSNAGRRSARVDAAAVEEAVDGEAVEAPTSTDGRAREGKGGLDDRDKRIVEQLQEDGRRSYAAIARAVGLSEAATRMRVQRLIDEEIVQIVAVARADAVGFHRQAMLGIRVEGDIRAVARELHQLGEAEYVVVCAGQFDLLVELVCEDDEHLLEVIDDRIRTIPGVRTTETFVYLRLEKENYQWGTR